MKEHDLKEMGLKVTSPRRKILAVLEESENHHLSAEDIYNALESKSQTIGLGTIYRVLTEFQKAGLVKRHHFENDYSVFELNTGNPHAHLVCVKCHHIEEFIDKTIQIRQQNIAEEANFQIIDLALNIYGVCGNCTVYP